MSGHTPGPWRVGELRDGRIRIASTKPELTIAAVRALPDWVAMGEANARLIAAAPELLAALHRLLSDDCPSRQYVNGHPAAAQAKAAITKATGA